MLQLSLHPLTAYSTQYLMIKFTSTQRLSISRLSCICCGAFARPLRVRSAHDRQAKATLQTVECDQERDDRRTGAVLSLRKTPS